MSIRDFDEMYCDDITFCAEQCGLESCPKNNKNIRDKTIPHSFSVGRPSDCPKCISHPSHILSLQHEQQNRVSNISIIPTVTVTDTPMVEYVPVVRCKDCKWFKEFTYNGKHEGRGLCDNPQNSMSKCPQIDWFCADGERREDAERNDPIR